MMILLPGFLLTLSSHFATGIPCEKRLLEQLFNESTYDVDMRPVRDHNQPVNVSVYTSIFQITELDELKQTIQLTLWIIFVGHNQLLHDYYADRLCGSWTDEHLQWLPSEYCGLEDVTVAATRVWRPEVVLYNSLSEEKPGMDMFMPTSIRICNNGSMRWATTALVLASCAVNLYNFPFDTQACPLTFSSWTLDYSQLRLSSELEQVSLESFTPNGAWELIDAPIKMSHRYYNSSKTKWTELDIILVLDRRPLFYLVNLVLPCVLLLCVGILAFCLSSESGEKIALTTTLLLTMMLFQIMVSDKLPPTSDYVPLFTTFFTSAVAILVGATAASVFVLSVSMKGEQGRPLPDWSHKIFAGRLPVVLGLQLSSAKVLDQPQPPSPPSTITNDLFTDERWNTKKRSTDESASCERGTCYQNTHTTSGSSSNNRYMHKITSDFDDAITRRNTWKSTDADDDNRKPESSVRDEAAQLFIEKQMRKEKFMREKAGWRLLAKIADRLFLILFLAAIIIVTLAVFIVAAVRDNLY